MPIKRENLPRYPPNWPEIAFAVKAAAAWRCQGSPAYPDCTAAHRRAHPITGSNVILAACHVDHMPENNTPGNLKAWCQRCHLRHDRQEHRIERYKTRYRRANTLELFAVL